jgi:hypothetical protein
MASPFPGMDPYLEGELWQEFHSTLAHTIRSQLQPQLQPHYVALLEKRYVIGQAIARTGKSVDVSIYPDVHVLQTKSLREPVATLDYSPAITPPSLELVEAEEIPQLRIEIRDVEQRRLITVIEILSPVNKTGRGLEEYMQKRHQLLETDTHLLEIDLLRRGGRVFISLDLPLAAYFVFLNRANRREITSVWAIHLPERLPVVPVPLLASDPDVRLDLQAAIEACFDLVHYEQLLDYTVPPPPPELDTAAATWLNAQLQQAGKR